MHVTTDPGLIRQDFCIPFFGPAIVRVQNLTNLSSYLQQRQHWRKIVILSVFVFLVFDAVREKSEDDTIKIKIRNLNHFCYFATYYYTYFLSPTFLIGNTEVVEKIKRNS